MKPAVQGPVAPCYFLKLGADLLLTNDWGGHAVLNRQEFESFLGGTLAPGSRISEELHSEGFIRDRLDFPALAARFANSSRGNGFSVTHTVEVTRRCNHACLYCSAGAKGLDADGQDMSEETARRAAQFILSCPADELQIEFQGGEPLLNWPIVRLMIETIEAGVRSAGEGRRVRFSLMSNLSLLDADRLDFLARHGVNVCSSLDGPRDVHEANRSALGGANHPVVTGWLRMIGTMLDAGLYPRMSPPNAVATVTRHSLPYSEKIVDEFLSLGLTRVQLGPVEPFGRARRIWSQVGVTAEEFLGFYRKALEHILRLCRHHPVVYEKGAKIFLEAIFGRRGAGSKWAEGLSQMAYDVHGDIYPSDEGRLLACEGNEFFRLGNVFKESPQDIRGHRLIPTQLLWNLRRAQPLCSRCAYAPFCQSVRLSPAHHLAEQGRPWGQLPSSRRCAIFRGVFDFLFEKLRDPEARAIFADWVEMD